MTLFLSALLPACGGRGFLPPDEVPCRTTLTPERRDAPGTEWVLPPDSADHSQLDAWCAAVGPAVHLPLDDPPAGDPDAGDPEPAIDSLAVLSWNVGIGSGDLARLVRDLREGRLTGGRPVRHFVLLLQEVHRAGDDVPPADALPDAARGAGLRRPAPPPGGRRDVVTLARELGLALYYVPSMRNGSEGPGEVPEDRGNAVLSTLPFTALRAVELPYELQRRVAVEATVRVPGDAAPAGLRAVSAHLDNAAASRPLASFGSLRANQAEGLVGALPEKVPLVVGGDFNTWWRGTDEEAFRIMRRAFPFPREPHGQPTATRLGRERILDYLFFRGPEGWRLDDRRIGRRYGSDHNPVIGWVVLPR